MIEKIIDYLATLFAKYFLKRSEHLNELVKSSMQIKMQKFQEIEKLNQKILDLENQKESLCTKISEEFNNLSILRKEFDSLCQKTAYLEEKIKQKIKSSTNLENFISSFKNSDK